jgi:hypothetical protein
MGLTYENGQRYWGKITSNKMGKAKTGTAQFILQFEIVGKINPADPDGDLLTCPTGERTVFRAITDKTIDWVLKDLEQLGFQGESFRLLDMDEPGGVNFQNRELAFFCEHKYGNDQKLREQWGISSGHKPLVIEPMEAKEIRALDNLFGRSLKGLGKGEPKPTAKERTQEKAKEVVQTEGEKMVDDLNQKLAEISEEEQNDAIPF